MKIANKTSYGLRFLLWLALADDKTQVTIKEVAAAENISEKFLESIAALIKMKGLVMVKRGSKGGYQLAKRPLQIKLSEVFEILETDMLYFIPSEDEQSLSTLNAQIINRLQKKLSDEVRVFLEKSTLQDLVDEYQKGTGDQMFYI